MMRLKPGLKFGVPSQLPANVPHQLFHREPEFD